MLPDEPTDIPEAEHILRFDAEEKDAGERADKVVLARMEGWSRQQVQRLFDAGRVWREDETLAKKQKIRTGDSLTLELPPPAETHLRPVALPLEILYEDADIIAINKAAGMVVHPGSGTGEDTLVHALLAHCGPSIIGVGSPERPGIVHRLDKETTGVLIAAKTNPAYQKLVQSFSARLPQKHYRALTSAPLPSASGCITEPIGRHPIHRHRMTARADGRPAESRWKTLKAFGHQAAFVDVRILSGRTHQIRVHMAHLGAPLVGDHTYGFRAKAWPFGSPRILLHAARLTIPHPLSGDTLTLEAPLPADFVKILSELRESPGLPGGEAS
ncbi:MAG: RluA family pseudouridine synthase [Opitutales bacterium]|nr:RluA family pseudouridine synthase [Opitutales bacterium]